MKIEERDGKALYGRGRFESSRLIGSWIVDAEIFNNCMDVALNGFISGDLNSTKHYVQKLTYQLIKVRRFTGHVRSLDHWSRRITYLIHTFHGK